MRYHVSGDVIAVLNSEKRILLVLAVRYGLTRDKLVDLMEMA